MNVRRPGERKHVHQLDFDREMDERGGCDQSYEGVDVKCPRCTEYNLLPSVIQYGHCIECKMPMAVHIEYGDENDAE